MTDAQKKMPYYHAQAGGGFIRYKSPNEIDLYGTSKWFGMADHELTAKILKK